MGTATLSEYRSPSYDYARDTGWNVPSPTEPASPGAILDGHDGTALFLTRTRMQADGVGSALEKAGVPYYSQDKLHGWNHDKVKNMPHLYNALQKIRGISPDNFSGSGLMRYSEGNADPDNLYLEAEEAATLLDYTNAKYLSETRSDINDKCDRIRGEEKDISLTEFDNYVDERFWARHTGGAASVDRLNKGSLTDRNRGALVQALKHNDEPVDLDDIPVGVMTIHASKGAEADNVVVYDGISKRVRQSMENSDRERANEYRTWYVALTRASEHLHIMRGGFRWTSSIIPHNIRDIASDREWDQ
jgi:DNA helicase-2/ATP-dependent DNA helicase PcrA